MRAVRPGEGTDGADVVPFARRRTAVGDPDGNALRLAELAGTVVISDAAFVLAELARDAAALESARVRKVS